MTYYGASELARSFRTVRKNTLAIAEDIPEHKYDYRPTPECRSVREILAHIAVSSQRSFRGHALQKVTTFAGIDWPAYIRDRQEQERQLAASSKAQLVEALRADGEAWGTYLDTVPEEELATVVEFSPGSAPPTKSRFEMLLSVKEHEMHHRGQLMVFERLLGVVPHLTRARLASMAQLQAK